MGNVPSPGSVRLSSDSVQDSETRPQGTAFMLPLAGRVQRARPRRPGRRRRRWSEPRPGCTGTRRWSPGTPGQGQGTSGGQGTSTHTLTQTRSFQTGGTRYLHLPASVRPIVRHEALGGDGGVARRRDGAVQSLGAQEGGLGPLGLHGDPGSALILDQIRHTPVSPRPAPGAVLPGPGTLRPSSW